MTANIAVLSRREHEVLLLVAEDKTDREIARALGIRERTVRAHVSSIILKLGVASRVGAAVALHQMDHCCRKPFARIIRGGMMRYLMLICGVEPDREPSAEDMAPAVAWTAEMTARGVRQSGNRLGPAGSATTVRVRDDELLLTDGPFAETYEQILGYDLLECANLDEAIEVAAKHPSARWGSIEVRPLWTG